jgi:hypothetical protein
MAVLHRGTLHAFGRPEDIAAELWQGVDAELELGAPIDDLTGDAVRSLPGVLAVAPAPLGATVRLATREDLPAVVKAVVDRGLSVYGASARTPSLEDVYFAVEARIAAAEGRRAPSASELLSGAVGVPT